LSYPHRAVELSGYLRVVTDLFRAVPHDPMVASRFDAEARDKYAKSPYHMDNRNKHNLTLLAQMLRPAPGGQKAGSSKRAGTVCENWNLGFCHDPCEYCRMHGTCSECGDSHRAKDNDKCLAALQARRRKKTGGDHAAGSSGSTGA
ncbi:hypothetical protein B0H10DRAFT_1851416, partial [Mycena sp. CBHHK59/15]